MNAADPIEELIARYLDGELPSNGERELADRLEADPAAVEQLKQYMQLDDLLDQFTHKNRNKNSFIKALSLRPLAGSARNPCTPCRSLA